LQITSLPPPVVTIIIQTKEFHLPAKKLNNKKLKTAKAISIISVKYWQTARVISLA